MVLDAADPESVSAGSFFTNPIVDPATAERLGSPKFPASDGKVKIPAAWLIERAGFHKGFTMGRAHISKKHALALVTDGATTEELLDLARAIQKGVEDKLGVRLEPEPILLGCTL
jgi:UDP-N-acetylmuramate dehydrogenase